jgi:small-conductance mechanosensitive channel
VTADVASIRRLVDRYFALGLAFAPLWTTLTPTVGFQWAWAAAVGSLAVLAVALVRYGPRHDSGEVWRFGGATLLAHVAASLVVEFGLGYRLAEHPVAAVAVWVATVVVGFAHVVRRRSGQRSTRDISRR